MFSQKRERNTDNSFFERYVLDEIKKNKPIWCNPSQRLLDSCRDIGCIQHTHTDLERTLNYSNKELKDLVRELCFDNLCGNCVAYGFPCTNACHNGGLHPKLDCFWTIVNE